MWYSSRERVKRALDLMETSRADWQVDAALGTASRAVDTACNRPAEALFPTLRTLYFDYPDPGYGGTRVYFGAYPLWTITNVKVGGVVLSTSLLKVYPQAPPYSWMELDLSQSGSLTTASTYQQSVSVTGWWGAGVSARPVPGALAAAVSDTTGTSITVNGRASSVLGIGDLIWIDSEYLEVTDRTMISTTQTIQTPLTASVANRALVVTTGSAYAVGEVLLVDQERLFVTDIAGNTLTVTRAYDGTTLATHTGSTIYASRQLTVLRAARGSNATTHTNGTTIDSWDTPSELESLCRAEAIQVLLQEQSGYSGANRYQGSQREGSKGAAIGVGLPGLREQVQGLWMHRSLHRVV